MTTPGSTAPALPERPGGTDAAHAYRAAVERLLAAMPRFHDRGSVPGTPAALSVRKAVPVELEWTVGRIRCMTLELGVDGFSVLLGTAPPPEERVKATLQIGRRDTVRTSARVAAVVEMQGSFRVSFAVGGAQVDRGAASRSSVACSTRSQPVARIRTAVAPPVLVRQRAADEPA